MYRFLVAMTGSLALAGAACATVDVDTCGQEIEDGETGVLVRDLACATVEAAVVLGEGSTLMMNGHSVSRATPGTSRYMLLCYEGPCTIVGPGEVRGSNWPYPAVEAAEDLTISNVTVRDNLHVGIHARRNIVATDVVVTGNGVAGMAAERNVYAANVVASGNGPPGQYGGNGIVARLLIGTDVTASNNSGPGVLARRVRVVGFEATGNLGPGVYSRGRAILENATVLGNQHLGSPLDVLSRAYPRLTNTTCDHSARYRRDEPPGPPFGVCALDE
jgi:hypothetical protein